MWLLDSSSKEPGARSVLEEDTILLECPNKEINDFKGLRLKKLHSSPIYKQVLESGRKLSLVKETF